MLEAKGRLGTTLLSFIVVLVAMVYICFKVPAMLGALFGFQSLAEDAITSGLFIDASAATFGASALGKTKQLFEGDKPVNRMDSG